MNTRTIIAALALAGLTATTAQAASVTGTVSTREQSPSLGLSIPAVVNELIGVVRTGPPNTENQSIRYRPRWRRDQNNSGGGSGPMNGYVQIHGGMFDPAGNVSNGAMFGMRVGTNSDDKIQFGGQLDWAHRGDRQTAVIGNGTLPGGGSVERRVELSSVSSDLVPLMAFVQVAPNGTSNGPYIGLAGGYQAMFVSARDFSTGEDFNATYDGFGWQFYAGYAFPLSGQSRLTLEGYSNSAELDRQVTDPATGVEYREIVDAGGLGLRGGVSWSF